MKHGAVVVWIETNGKIVSQGTVAVRTAMRVADTIAETGLPVVVLTREEIIQSKTFRKEIDKDNE